MSGEACGDTGEYDLKKAIYSKKASRDLLINNQTTLKKKKKAIYKMKYIQCMREKMEIDGKNVLVEISFFKQYSFSLRLL